MSINRVQVDGVVTHPALRYATDGKPEYRFVLEHVDELPDGGHFTLYVSCCASGKAAERLHAQLDEGMAIEVTGGRICYRKRDTRQGEFSRMEVFVWAVKPSRAPSPAAVHQEATQGDVLSEDRTLRSEASRPIRKPRYPKALQQPWSRAQQN